ncbi:unnamed protein product [Aphanomyces euteiches]|nr:hypothetical protein AC1031_007528 [Aphanomyces cochlioides]KAH9062919.1 hypothetical protein Ae201684P_009185 [Aphanomyces euteiches]KAH9115672.1 hypothetical protein AeMF1_010316 [Aphanomyces euteiches]KAH9118336.1 hypothetical protein LEN26_012177 [Aphanomyces euteiches]KAH9138306.1 hypothetical protein LEN26_005352 [Aphanomyces euteiches]
MQWSANTTLKATRNYGTLQPIPEEENELSPMLRSNYMSPGLRKSSFRRVDSMPYATKNGATTLNPRALVYVISVPAVLFLFFMFIFILRASAPRTDLLWRDCAYEPWQTSEACDSDYALAYRASSIVANLTWQEKLTQCRVLYNGLPMLNLSTFNYCQEAKFKKLLQTHAAEFSPIDMTTSCEHFYVRSSQPPIQSVTDCKAALGDLIENGVLLSLTDDEVAICAQYHYSQSQVSTLNDVLMRLLAGRILADETQEITADGIELGSPENFHAGSGVKM